MNFRRASSWQPSFLDRKAAALRVFRAKTLAKKMDARVKRLFGCRCKVSVKGLGVRLVLEALANESVTVDLSVDIESAGAHSRNGAG
jgi:hypothetical protein